MRVNLFINTILIKITINFILKKNGIRKNNENYKFDYNSQIIVVLYFAVT